MDESFKTREIPSATQKRNLCYLLREEMKESNHQLVHFSRLFTFNLLFNVIKMYNFKNNNNKMSNLKYL